MISISIENLLEGKVAFTIEVPVEDLEPYLAKGAQKLSLEKPVSGWRPGKIDYKNAEKHYGAMPLYQASLEFVVQGTLEKALQKQNKDIIGSPEISVVKCAPQNPIVYKATYYKRPTVTLGDYKKLPFSRKEIAIFEKDVDNFLNQLLESRAKETLVTRPAQKGDHVVIDYTMYLDNVPIDGGQGKVQHIILGRDELIPGFNEKLEGLSPNNEKEFNLKMPKIYPVKQVAGKTVEFKIILKSVYERILSKADDTFAKSVGNFSSLNELKRHLKKNLTKEAEQKEQQRLEGELLNSLEKISTFSEVPDILIKAEAKQLLTENKELIMRRGLKWEDYLEHLKRSEDEFFKGLLPSAESRIKKNLVISELAKQKKVTVADDEIEKELNLLLKINPKAKKVLSEDKSKIGIMKNNLRSVLTNKKTLDLILEEMLQKK